MAQHRVQADGIQGRRLQDASSFKMKAALDCPSEGGWGLQIQMQDRRVPPNQRGSSIYKGGLGLTANSWGRVGKPRLLTFSREGKMCSNIRRYQGPASLP